MSLCLTTELQNTWSRNWYISRRKWISLQLQQKKKVKTALPVINGTSKQNQWIYSCIWQPTPVLLPGKSQGRSLVGYSPWGRKDSDTTERLHFIELNDAIKHQGLIKISRTLPQDSIIHFFFSKCTQNIYQDRLYPGS